MSKRKARCCVRCLKPMGNSFFLYKGSHLHRRCYNMMMFGYKYVPDRRLRCEKYISYKRGCELMIEEKKEIIRC
jgi:hypothetical protein